MVSGARVGPGMTTPRGSDALNEQVAEFFRGSRLQYLALDYGGKTIRLSRPDPTTVRASAVGRIASADDSQGYPAAGSAVRAGETLFLIRRYKSEIPVVSPAAGTLVAVLAADGAFVEYGEPLACVE